MQRNPLNGPSELLGSWEVSLRKILRLDLLTSREVRARIKLLCRFTVVAVYLSRQVRAQLAARVPPRREGRTEGAQVGCASLGALRSPVLAG